MLLDISLAAYGRTRSFKDTIAQRAWSVGVTAAFECERARVDSVEIDRTDFQGRVQLRVVPRLAPERPGRTVDLTVAFLVDGREIQRQSFRAFTGDPPLEWHFEFTNQEFAEMFDPGRSPVLRVILEVWGLAGRKAEDCLRQPELGIRSSSP
jgi:hypothetical protein